MPAQIIPFPQELRPRLPTLVGNVDSLSLRQRLEQIDALLRQSGVNCSALPIGCQPGRCGRPSTQLLRAAIERPRKLGLQEPLDLEEYFLDSTCLKANLHFPTDWVLLRDGVRTLMKATLLIRTARLRGRMKAPEEFLRRLNRLSLQMTPQARRSGSRKGRKRVLRQMKQLVGVVRAHGGGFGEETWTEQRGETVFQLAKGTSA